MPHVNVVIYYKFHRFWRDAIEIVLAENVIDRNLADFNSLIRRYMLNERKCPEKIITKRTVNSVFEDKL